MKRVVLYARVSTEDQARHGYSLPSQLEECRKYAQERGWTVVAALSDDGVSGATLDRPGLDRIRDMAHAGEIDGVIVYDLDRLSRKVVHQLLIEEELGKLGVAIHYVVGDYDDSDEGRLQKQIRAAIAEYERAKLRERMVRGRRAKVKAGNVLVHTTPPYGYRVVTDPTTQKDKLVPLEEEARIVRLIYHWYAYDNMSMGAIARRLSELRIPTRLDTMPTRGGAKKRGYGQWSRATVAKILSREVYIGTWYYAKWNNGRQNPRDWWLAVEVPPLVERETWELAQKRRRLNREMAKRNNKYQYLMRQRLTCGFCGTKIAGHPNLWRSKNASGLNLYYRCPAREGAVVGVSCALPQFRVEEVDGAVWGWVEELLLDPRNLALGLREQQAERQRAARPLRERLDIIEDQIAKHQQQLSKLLDLYLEGGFPKEVLTERRVRLEKTLASLVQEREGLKEQLRAYEITDEQIATLEEFANLIVQGLQRLTFEDKRRIIDLLDVWGTLAVEDGRKVIYVRGTVGEQTLNIASIPSRARSGGG